MIDVIPYTSARADDFITVYRACLSHYKISPATPTQETRIVSLLNGERHMACHLAYEAKTCVGFATWGLSFPAGATTSLVMKELFVIPKAQGQGVGRALLSALTRVAEIEGCDLLDWATDGENTASQAFYAKIKAPEKEKVTYRVLASEFAEFRARLGH